ncbi:uncharacterized protein I206_105017 [Kwoniella pini CBS 10737]|uniref:Anaphase-promoting complex subunit 4-like WD40 domain-containing protein n=1 Tax=Kwoniella pini CBS 10737 TaxID=1296096 RepID=A0A1B9I8K0_9TREE|nr:uncharacterized protein I206_02556 [Kwoniella pini CBS 10737]OCF51840.1 hypothetical protein I206_02556 [Kwoniella pini CBS 10737]
MELYIPPPTNFFRILPPKPVVPAVPVVPVGDLPDKLHAPEGTYHLNPPEGFSNIGNPAHPSAAELARQQQNTSTFLAGASGFMVAGPGMLPGSFPGGPPASTAMSYGSSIVNGQAQPSNPVKMSFVNIWFPPKQINDQRSFGGLLSKQQTNSNLNSGIINDLQPPKEESYLYEPSINSELDEISSSPSTDFPTSNVLLNDFSIPPGGQNTSSSTTKRIPFTKNNQNQITSSTTNNNGINNINLPRPKNNLRSSSSTFVTRAQIQENLLKTLAEKGRNGGEMARYGFWNLGRTFGWGEENPKTKEPLTRITFSQLPSCHAVNLHTLGPDRVDVVIGFTSGDLIWVDFAIGKYSRLNKGGLLNNTTVLGVHFDPRQPHHLIAHFADSTILRFHLFADDPPTSIMAFVLPWNNYFDSMRRGSNTSTSSIEAKAEPGEEDWEEGLIKWKNEDWNLLNTLPAKSKKEDLGSWAGKNPIAAYKIDKVKISAMAYSPDGRFLAIAAEDGNLRMVDVAEEQLTDTFAGYFGSLTCVAWSPDSRFVAVGGQDDLITIFSARESRIVARCQGHSAFVTSIAFDQSRGEARAYRFASVGEDAKLILWDFSAAALHRPRHHHPTTSHHKLGAGGSSLSLSAGHSKSNLPVNVQSSIFHPAPPRSEVALLQPVMTRVVEGNLLTGVHMIQTSIVTVSRAAQVKFWSRPPRNNHSHHNTKSRAASRGANSNGRRERETGITA